MESIAGPYKWESMGFNDGINPAMLVFEDNNMGNNKTTYSLWTGGQIRVADDPNGPFEVVVNATYPGDNPAPIYHEGKFYMTNQHTKFVWTSSSLSGPWTLYSDIQVNEQPDTSTILEDPTLWIDARGHWHIINHAYDMSQQHECGRSILSAHLFSVDGKKWYKSDVEPYGHVVEYEDGTQHVYTTLERPYIHMNEKKQLTHIVLSADLETGNEGCLEDCATQDDLRHCACVNCKYYDVAGTVILTLEE